MEDLEETNRTVNLNYCFLCFINKSELIELSAEAGVALDIRNIMSKHFWFGINDMVDNFVCFECWHKVDNFHTFYLQVEKSYKPEDINIKIESFCHESEDNASDNNEIIKGEDEESSDGIDHNDMDFKNESSSDSCEELLDRKRKTKSKNSLINEKSCADKKTKKFSLEHLLKIEQEDKKIKEFCKMKCDICLEEFESFRQIKKHYKSEHNQKGYIECCARKYDERSRLVEHITVHVNPQAFHCNICSKNYCSQRSLDCHKTMAHGPEEMRQFKCDKCPRSYVKRHQLTKHQIHHIPEEDKKFICSQCNKAFPTGYILQQHVRGIHEGANSLMCDICSKVLKSKQTFLSHRKEHFEIKKVQCTICGSWLKNDNTLRKHTKRHKEESMVFICDLCGKRSPNRHALLKHKSDLHIMQRNHKCTLCEKAFKRAIALKEHLATHTGEPLYSCLYCTKTFNSSANMHSHKKKMHRLEWEENQRLRALP